MVHISGLKKESKTYILSYHLEKSVKKILDAATSLIMLCELAKVLSLIPSRTIRPTCSENNSAFLGWLICVRRPVMRAHLSTKV